MDLLLLCLPWMALGLYMVLFVRTPPRLSNVSPPWNGPAPSVSVIVPARNEETNLPPLLRSLSALEYPDFEILVVDDGSDDRTAVLVTGAEPGNAAQVRLIPGEALPEGWFGKPWACSQGARAAKGELLLFTDADTVHAPALLSQAVATLAAERADVLSLIGRQVMGSFWERLLQPQFFMLLAARFPRTGTPRKPRHWRHAIANGQYLLFRRTVYDALGRHEVVKGEVVEDMRLAQLLVQGGFRLVVREGAGLRTRMYRSLGGLVEGWSKNITTGALQATAGWLRPLILPLSLVVGLGLWLLPPVLGAAAVLTGTGAPVLHFCLAATGFGVVYWGVASGIMGGNPAYGLLYPLGSVLAAYIFVLSWVRGGRIRWKGRSYTVSREVRAGGPAGARVEPTDPKARSTREPGDAPA